MALSFFEDKSNAPSADEVAAALGGCGKIWSALVEDIEGRFAPVVHQWNFAGAKFGWSLRLKQKERVILYLTPQKGCFLAGVVLGEKAVKAAHDARLTAPVLALIDEAPRYAEGRGIRLTVKKAADAAAVRKLVSLKMGV